MSGAAARRTVFLTGASGDGGRHVLAELLDRADHLDVVALVLPAGDVATPLSSACAQGHTFTGSSRLVLTAGHWCPECVRRPEDYVRQAQHNAHLAQVVSGQGAPATADHDERGSNATVLSRRPDGAG
jgi:hypothetical protein